MQQIALLDVNNPPVHPWTCVAPELIERTGNGFRAMKSRALPLGFYFRPRCLQSVMVEVNLTVRGGDAFSCLLGDYQFYIGGSGEPGARLTLDRWPLAVSGKIHMAQGAHAIICRRMCGKVSLSLDDQIVMEADDPRVDDPVPALELHLSDEYILNSAVVTGEPAHAPGLPSKINSSYNLHVCIDFFDDIIEYPWTQRTLTDLMEIYRKNTVRRVYLIDHGGLKSGFWDSFDCAHEVALNARRTYDQVGEILPAVTAAAHNAGMEVFAVYKPQENAMATTYPYGTDLARQYGRVPRVDGMMYWVMDFVAKHPEMRLERGIHSLPLNLDERVVGKILLVSESGLNPGFDPQRIRLLVSSDNNGYVPYAGPMKIRDEGNGKIVMDGLDVKEKFMALTVTGQGTHYFGNVLRNLAAVYDRDGRILPVSHATLTRPRNLAPAHAGFMFDYPVDTVSELENYFWLDGGKPLGLAKGGERYLCGVLCEAYPEVLQYWMDNIERCIASGVDGVDIRDLVHTRTMDWDAFGFNQPLVAAFKKKYDVDMRTQPFNRADLRRLRGEYYTDFLRQARARLSATGRQMHLHVSPRMKSPVWHTELDVFQDWEGWLRDGLADEVTLKTSALNGVVAARALIRARQMNIPVNYCPYLNGMPKLPHARQLLEYMAQNAMDKGMSGFVIYENKAVMAARADGGLDVTQQWMLDILSRYARRQPA